MALNRNDIAILLERAKHGDEQAATRLITLFKGLVFTVIYRMVNDYHISEDLTQDTFVRAFLHIKKVKSEKHFRAWICTIARNIARDHFRREKRHPTVSLDDVGEQTGQSGLEMTRKRIIIEDALGRLSERDRMLLTLAYYEGMSLAEVAQVMKLTEKNVKVCLYRARKRLRQELKGYERELVPA